MVSLYNAAAFMEEILMMKCNFLVLIIAIFFQKWICVTICNIQAIPIPLWSDVWKLQIAILDELYLLSYFRPSYMALVTFNSNNYYNVYTSFYVLCYFLNEFPLESDVKICWRVVTIVNCDANATELMVTIIIIN